MLSLCIFFGVKSNLNIHIKSFLCFLDLTPCSRVPLEKLILTHLVKKCQEIPCLLWNLKVHYCIHKGLPQIPVLIQMNLVHTFPLYFPKIHSNIILPSMSTSSKWSLPFRLKVMFILKLLKCLLELFFWQVITYGILISKSVTTH